MNTVPGSNPTSASRRDYVWQAVVRMDNTTLAMNAVCVALLFLGLLWRFIDLRYPGQFTFDEHHFVLNARNYLEHKADWNDHPPLGKLLLIPGIWLFGDNGLGWRVSSAVLGVGIVVVAGLNSQRLFQRNDVALLTAAFVAVDGLFVSYARTALLDTPLTFFMYVALYCMLHSSLRAFAWAAVFIGLAVAVKWTGICVFLLAPWLLWRRRRSIFHAAWMFAIIVAVYVCIWASALWLTRQPLSFAGMFASNANLLKHHAGFTVWDNSASSAWYTWPFLVHPIVMFYQEVAANTVRATTCVGNPLVWIAATAAVLWTLERVSVGGHARWGERQASPSSGMQISIGAMVALQLPFILTSRQSYIWHYMGAYGLALGLLAFVLLSHMARQARLVVGFVVAAACVSLVYAPLWTNTVISTSGYLARLPFASWR